MHVHHFLPLAMAAALACASASAQLKLPKGAQAAPAAAPGAAQPQAAPTAPADKQNLEKEAAGSLAAAGWLTLLDRRDWGRAWETSAGMFRNTVPLPSWMDGIPKLREPLGPLVERSPAQSQYKPTLEGRPAGEYVSVAFLTKFDKREVEEIVTTVREADGKWRVTGYSTR